jgi:hypothetical protein
VLRAMLVGLLLGAGLVVAPVGHADPETCPPTCDRIPPTAWIAPNRIPLDSTRHWPHPATVAEPVTAPRFKFEELCGTPRPRDDPREYAVAARAVIPGAPDDWQLQAQVIHWRGETWHGGQSAAQVYDDALAALQTCQRRAPAFSPTITVADHERLAAVISGPYVVHQYLLADPRNSTVSELVLWTTRESGAEWPVVPDEWVLDALEGALCGAYLSSCG